MLSSESLDTNSMVSCLNHDGMVVVSLLKLWVRTLFIARCTPTNYLLLVEITNRLSITSWDYQLIIYYYWLTATGYNRFIITFSVFLSNGLVDWCFFNTNFSNTPCPATLWPEQTILKFLKKLIFIQKHS
jgi:hypothetical protein